MRSLPLALVVGLLINALVAGEEKEARKVHRVDLKDVYSKIPQEGLTELKGRDDAQKLELQLIHQNLGRTTLPCAFLVRADDLAGAIKVSCEVALGSGHTDRAAAERFGPGASQTLWAVVYLGRSGTRPLAWTLEPPEVEGNRVRVTYSTAKLTPGDLREYVYVFKVGRLRKGRCHLELRQVGDPEPLLVRRVLVGDD